MAAKRKTAATKPRDDKDSVRRARIQVDLSYEAQCCFLRLHEKTDASTNADIVRRSVKAYEWLIDAKQRGAVVQTIEPDGTIRQIELLL